MGGWGEGVCGGRGGMGGWGEGVCGGRGGMGGWGEGVCGGRGGMGGWGEGKGGNEWVCVVGGEGMDGCAGERRGMCIWKRGMKKGMWWEEDEWTSYCVIGNWEMRRERVWEGFGRCKVVN